MMVTESKNVPVLTLEAANALIPELNVLFDAQRDRRKQIEALLGELTQLLGTTPHSLEISEHDTPSVRTLKEEIARAVEEYDAAWQSLQQMGGVLKDMRLGLVDFYGRVDDQLVWLCWKHGEREICHYHALNEGFSGRKEIKGSMRLRLLN